MAPNYGRRPGSRLLVFIVVLVVVVDSSASPRGEFDDEDDDDDNDNDYGLHESPTLGVMHSGAGGTCGPHRPRQGAAAETTRFSSASKSS